MGTWRSGYAVDRRAGWAPAISVPVGAIAVVINSIRDDGDIRAGVLPWAMVLVVVAFGACALATLCLHGPDPSRWMVAGAWWSAAAKRIPGWARLAVWIAAPALPLLLVYGGLFEGTVETIGSAVLIAAFGIGWLLLGLAVATSHPTAIDDSGATPSPTGRPGSSS